GPAPAPTIARATENPPASGPAELAPYSPQQQGTRRREQHPEYTDPGEVSSIGPACRPWERGPRQLRHDDRTGPVDKDHEAHDAEQRTPAKHEGRYARERGHRHDPSHGDDEGGQRT